MTRVAVIGVGAMGRNHVRVYSEMPDVELVGVADARPAGGRGVRRRYRRPGLRRLRRMLDEQRPDAVTIAVPTVDHLTRGHGGHRAWHALC